MKSKHSLTSSFGFAIEGIWTFFARERNARIQLTLWLCALLLGFIIKIKSGEWLAIVVCGGSVLSLEMVNSAMETFLDLIHPDRHPMVKKVKDLMAGAVLIMSISALSIAFIVFVPYLYKMF